MNSKIPVNRPYLPPLEEYQKLVSEVWGRNVLTNNGPLVRRLEQELCEFLNVKNLVLVSNGTIAIHLALRALGLNGKILTTPFSFVSTTSSLIWEGCEPVFCDILEDSFTLDPESVEQQITNDCVAILATHVYGRPCQIEAIESIASKNNLKVIYDGAHAFGLNYKGRSLLNYGDITTVSFHATKTFHTIEGGALICRDDVIAQRVREIRNFGYTGPDEFSGLGTNAKLSELHAAMGLVNLSYISDILRKRLAVLKEYIHCLRECTDLTMTVTPDDGLLSYFPILLKDENQRQALMVYLDNRGVGSRKYFDPLLSELPYVNSSPSLPVANSVANRVLCLPFYTELSLEEVREVCVHVKRFLSEDNA